MNLSNPAYYFNREQSWLKFNQRVLEEAQDKTNPLMERIKFLSITASNLDEFFMVRVSSLWEQEPNRQDASGLTPAQQLAAISRITHEMTAKQYHCLNKSLLPAMRKAGIHFLTYEQLDKKQQAFADSYFEETLYKVLTPMAIDQSRPFPVLNNRAIILFIELTLSHKPGDPLYAVMQVPTVLPRLVKLPSDAERHDFILLEELVLAHTGALFPGHQVKKVSFLRVTRNSDLVIDEEEMEDLLDEMERSIRRRRWGDPVRIEVSRDIGPAALRMLTYALDISHEEIYRVNGPLDLTVWQKLAANPAFASLSNKPLPPRPAVAFMEAESLFDVIRRQDVLVHHPYMSFDPVTRFVQEAATDPHVLAIKQTLYRVSGKSPIVHALINAAENGKQVTVLIELRARFDEENNILWAKKLEQAGVHVVYGLVGLKTHCKVCLVVRREDDGIKRYVHLSTGNYNDTTAKIYTDTGLFTCREPLGQDSSTLFNVLTGYARTLDWQRFAVAPTTMRGAFLQLIETEAKYAKEGTPAAIDAKMNSLSDTELIQALYRASMAGVKIRLLVRGICCLKPGLPKVSENIEVSGIVDRFLEHGRVFVFQNGGKPRVFLSSADWMPRNLDRRVEVMFPIEDDALKDELIDMLELSFSDNTKRRVLDETGAYKKPNRRGKAAVWSQPDFYGRVAAAYTQAQKSGRNMFKPVYK